MSAGYTALKIADIEGAYGGAFKKVRAALGASSFGLQIIEMPANMDGYPEHDHSQDGQEEIYITLSGGGTMQVDGDTVTVDGETVVRVGPGIKRKLLPGDQGWRVAVVGGVPGKAYEAAEFSKLDGES